MDKATGLEELKLSRREFEATYADVPAEAYPYLRPGEDYALGGIIPHVEATLRRYGRVMAAITSGGWRQVTAKDPEEEVERLAREAHDGPDPAAAWPALEAAHADLIATLDGVAPEEWDRAVPVVYGPGQEPFPTSAEMIAVWIIDHYREHVPQARELLAEYGERR